MTFATKAIATFGLALLAVLGNIINLPLFFGVHFIFGSVAVMLAIVIISNQSSLVTVRNVNQSRKRSHWKVIVILISHRRYSLSF